MKALLLILLLPLSAIAQTTYPVLSTTTARTIVGGITNLPHLNSNNVFTGTGRWTGAVTLTNSGNVFAGDGSGLTGISAGISTSGGSATNLSVYSSGTTNRALRVYGTNGTSLFAVTVDGYAMAKKAPSGTPGFFFEGDATTGLGSVAAGELTLVQNGANVVRIQDTWGVTIAGNIGFSYDTYLARNSAGLIEINNVSSGQYRDLLARSLYATNLYATNLIINGGATVTKILSATATLNFDLTALTVEDLTITVTGAADGDVVTLGVPNGSITTSVQYTAWVSAADTVTVRARTSAVGENPASGTFRATIIKH